MTPFLLRSPLVTDRLDLRLLRSDDVDAVHAYQSLPEVAQYQLFEPRTREQVAERIADRSSHDRLADSGDFLQLAIERRSDQRVIGDLYLALRSVDDSTAAIGWSLHPAAQGQGFATEAARAGLATAFETMHLHRVVADLDPRNTASIALCLRLGMRQEAHFVRDLLFKGGWADTLVFAILDREWTDLP